MVFKNHGKLNKVLSKTSSCQFNCDEILTVHQEKAQTNKNSFALIKKRRPKILGIDIDNVF